MSGGVTVRGMTHTNDDDGYDLAAFYAEANSLLGTTWLDEAACATSPLEDFFAAGRPKVETVETCRRCPVKWNCLETKAHVEQAIGVSDIRFGVVGGLTAVERKRLYEKPRNTWPVEQVRQIDAYLKERYLARDLPEELRNALYPEGF